MIRHDLDQLAPDLQAAPFDKICDLWELVEDEWGDDGKTWLGRNDRYYLLTRLLHRFDAVHPWIYARCREVEASPDGYLDLWAREHYKAVDVNEPVPTPSGWARHGDLKAGDWVFGPDGMPTQVVGRTEVFNDADCWRVTFDDGYSVVVSGQHLWTVEQRSRKRVKGGIGQQRIGRVSVTLDTRAMARHDHRQDNRLSIRALLPVVMPTGILPIEPYTLGAWLGDGHNADGRVTCGDLEVFHRIKEDGYQLSPNCRKQAGAETRTVYGISALLRGLGLRGNKHIPMMYLRASQEQRWAMLQGLMDTDGHCSTRGRGVFVNKCERLASDVFELANTLGLKPQLNRYEPDHGSVWQVVFQTCGGIEAFNIPRKQARSRTDASSKRRFVVSVDPVESRPVSCIQVSRADGQYIIGRYWVTTHNSTVITFAGIIQEIIRDPEITIGIFSHTKPVARKFLLQIKQELEVNRELQSVYPDVFYAEPTRESSKWSEEKGIVVRRKSNPKEATVEAHGLVDGQPTGAHFLLRVYDDVVTRESVSTPDQVKKTTEAWELSDNLGARGEAGNMRAWHVGTRYSFADTYADIIEKQALKVRLYPATHNGLPDGTPVFLTPEAWADKRLKQGPATIACQQLMNPAAGNEAMFRKDWLSFIDIRPATLNVYIMVDPAHSKKKGSDNTAMAVIGIDAGGNKYLLDGYRHKMGLKERWTAMAGLRKVWMAQPGVQMVKVGYERYGMQADLEYFEEQMLATKDAFEIIELNWVSDGGQSKDDRVQRLQPDFQSRKFYLAAVVDGETANQKRIKAQGQSFRVFQPVKRRDHEGNVYSLNRGFLEEYLTYPFSAKKDLIDATSRVYDMEPVVPIIIDESSLMPEIYADGA